MSVQLTGSESTLISLLYSEDKHPDDITTAEAFVCPPSSRLIINSNCSESSYKKRTFVFRESTTNSPLSLSLSPQLN